MKKLVFSLAAIVSCLVVMTVCNSCSKTDNNEGNRMVKELSEWLNLDADGNCPYLCTENGEYLLGADRVRDASAQAKNVSLGASETGSLTLPDDMGTIRVSIPDDQQGIFYEISYNVKGISVKKLLIVSNEILENGNENVMINPATTSKVYVYSCNNDKGNCGKTMYVSSTITRCTHCGGSVKKIR